MVTESYPGAVAVMETGPLVSSTSANTAVAPADETIAVTEPAVGEIPPVSRTFEGSELVSVIVTGEFGGKGPTLMPTTLDKLRPRGGTNMLMVPLKRRTST